MTTPARRDYTFAAPVHGAGTWTFVVAPGKTDAFGRMPNMATITLKTLWDNHPYPDFPCDQTLFPNQCAIRMGVALERSGVSMVSFVGARCYARPSHSSKHILRAQELADWLLKQTTVVGSVIKHKKKVTSADFWGTTGIVFIRDGWGPTDHIDVWDGEDLKGGSLDYFFRGKEVWFWELPRE